MLTFAALFRNTIIHSVPICMKQLFRDYWPYLLALLPALLLRDFSPATELRYISCATETLREGNIFNLTYQGEPFPEIMPLYIWLIAGLKWLLGHHYMISIGLFSFLPAIGILWVMNRWVERFDTRSFRLCDGSQSRMLASFMLFTCGMQCTMAFFVSPCMLFCFFIVCSLYTFWRITAEQGAYGPSPDRRSRRRLQWYFGLCIFLAVFTNGPLGICIPLVSTTLFLLFSGRLRYWGRVWSWRVWLTLSVLIGLWMYGTWCEGGTEAIDRLMMQEPLRQVFNPVSHDRPWYYYLVSLWAVSIPWGPFCLIVLIASFIKRVRSGSFSWRKPFDSSLQSFFVCTFIVAFIYFSLIRYKLDVNMLPAYPFLVYAGVMQLGQWRWPLRWNWPIIRTCRVVLLIIFLGGCLTPWLNINAGCYGRICYHANDLKRELGTQHVYVYHLRRAAGMDAYLHEDPIDAKPQDIADGKLQNTLLIMKEYRLKSLRKQLDKLGVPAEKQGKVIDELGAYVILHFE